MTEIPAAPAEPTPPSHHPRRRLVFYVAAGLVVAAITFFGVQSAVSTVSDAFTTAQQQRADDGDVPAYVDEMLPYTSTTEGFSVIGPGEPTVEREPDFSADGYDMPRTKTKWTVGEEGTFVAYFVGTIDLSAMAADGTLDPEARLEDSIENIILGLHAAPVRDYEKSTRFGDPAISGSIQFDDGSWQRFLLVMHNNVQYMLIAWEQDSDIDETFIDSFTVLD
jgi:hypothetical protein